MRPLFPKRFVEKIDLISPTKNPAEARRIRKVITPANLPTRFGGNLDVWPPPLGRERAPW